MAYLAMSPLAVALAGKLNVAGLTALFSGSPTVGVHDDIPQDAPLPLTWIEVPLEQDQRGFGTGEFGRVDFRIHHFSEYEGTREVQLMTAKAIELLKDQALSVTGYTQAGLVFYDRSQLLTDQVLHGRKCREMVSFFYTFLEA